MKIDVRSESNARKMLSAYVEKVDRNLGRHQIDAIVLVGSLATNSFVGGPGSDIDQITVVCDDCSNDILDVVGVLLHEVEDEYGFGIPFARSVYFRNELRRPFKTTFPFVKENKKYIEVPVELLRMHESGKVIWGKQDIIPLLPTPSREEIMLFHKLSRHFSHELAKSEMYQQKKLHELPPRLSAQVIITNAFRHYYYATGYVCSNKLKIAELMRENIDGYKYQSALELSTVMKSNMLDSKMPLSAEQIDFLVDQAVSLLEWQDSNEVGDIPLNSET